MVMYGHRTNLQPDSSQKLLLALNLLLLGNTGRPECGLQTG
jgi:hypothetical protein